MLTFGQWLAKYGDVPCDGCVYNIARYAKCTYKGRCVRYTVYRKDERRKHNADKDFHDD